MNRWKEYFDELLNPGQTRTRNVIKNKDGREI